MWTPLLLILSLAVSSLAITCKEPQVNSNVEIEGSDYTYGKTIKFKCKDGFRLTGTSIATCTATGWDQQPPSCSAKSCNNPGIPDNGARTGDNFNTYSTVTFTCNTGFELTPPDTATIICLPNTRWNKPSPFCEPVKCPTLQRLENGRLSTELFQYGQTITFQCFPGYQLQGNPEISCHASGTWDKDMPQCTPCPRNHYKPGVNQDTCKSCPVRSITLSTATTSIDHCMCEEGSSKQDDGICVAIRCIPLTAPENGAISNCEPSSGSQCTFGCNPGYILSGARERRCIETGWTGRPPVCTACPENSYQAAPGSQTCYRCPVNTHTDGMIGISLNSCVCKEGYTRASGAVGRCYDINECLGDNGGCEDRCANTQGGYYCQCTTPGYALSEDGKTCYKKNCGFPEGLIHGSMSMNGKYVGDVATYECGEGYKLIGNQMRVCAEDGTWTGSTPVCQSAAINCKAPAVTENVEIYYSFGEAINFKCKDGFHLQGSPKATCTANGWDKEPPSCSGN